MRRHLDRNIKDVIAEFPAVQQVLAGHGIGCASCAVGTCLLREIIDVHGLSVEQEREVMRGIAQVIYPDRKTELPPLPRKTGPATGRRPGFSPPMRVLVEEHVLIKRLLSLVPWIASGLQAGSGAAFAAASAALAFIRGYADRFHHAKEEDILFAYFDPPGEIIASMRREHEVGRGLVRETAAAIEALDGTRAAGHLLAYRTLLEEHIRKEDEVLYPFLDRKLSVSQVGEMFSRFTAVEREAGQVPVDLARQVGELEQAAHAVGAVPPG